MDDIEKRITYFERVLDAAERVRNLNQSRIKEYIDTVSAIKKMNYMTMEFFMSSENAKVNPNLSPKEVYEQFQKVLKNLGVNPPEEPIDPSVPVPPPPPEKDPTEPTKSIENGRLDRLKRLSVILTEQLRANVDFQKHANEALVETQRKSFELYKQIDDHIRKR